MLKRLFRSAEHLSWFKISLAISEPFNEADTEKKLKENKASRYNLKSKIYLKHL